MNSIALKNNRQFLEHLDELQTFVMHVMLLITVHSYTSMVLGMTNYHIRPHRTTCEWLGSTEDVICLCGITHHHNLLKFHYCFDGPIDMK